MPHHLMVRGVKYSTLEHPTDPHTYINHASVDSSEVLHLYSGNVVTDENGQAEVVLPDYFDGLNRDVRYQLTVVGQWAHAVVLEEETNNCFTIATDKGQVKVSWQVTAVRNDAYMHEHPWQARIARPDDYDRSIEEGRKISQTMQANMERMRARGDEMRRHIPTPRPPTPDEPPPEQNDRW